MVGAMAKLASYGPMANNGLQMTYSGWMIPLCDDAILGTLEKVFICIVSNCGVSGTDIVIHTESGANQKLCGSYDM